MGDKSLVGTWKLVSCEVKRGDGRVSYPYGKNPRGYIMYDDAGYMSVAIMRENRPAFASGGLRGGTVQQKSEAADTYLSYAGRYALHADKVVHRVEVILFPNWVGTELERSIHVADGKLTLSSPPDRIGGVDRTTHIVWERAEERRG